MNHIEWCIQDRIEKIKQIVTDDNWYLSYSGGKDSELVHVLLDMALPNNNIKRVYFQIFGESEITKEFVKNKTQTDSRFEILKIPYTNLADIGYPFKSKDFAESIYEYHIHGKTFKTKKAERLIKEEYGGRYKCPKVLEYLMDELPFKISKQCCRVHKTKGS